MKFRHNTERFLWFLLTHQLLIQWRQKTLALNLLDIKNHKLSNSLEFFVNLLNRLRIHFDRVKNNNMPSCPSRAKLASSLSYNIKKTDAIRTLDKQKISVTRLEEQATEFIADINAVE